MDWSERRKLRYLRIISELPRYSLPLLTAGMLNICCSNLIPYREKHADNARLEYDKDLAAIVLADKPDLVVCAGWMSVLVDTFLDPLAEANVAVINLHPALPVGGNLVSLLSSLRIDLNRDNSMALKPSSGRIKHGLRVRSRRLGSSSTT